METNFDDSTKKIKISDNECVVERKRQRSSYINSDVSYVIDQEIPDEFFGKPQFINF